MVKPFQRLGRRHKRKTVETVFQRLAAPFNRLKPAAHESQRHLQETEMRL
jgi:hypothetical protein